MADQDDDNLQMALRMSLQNSPPEAKRSKPRENAGASMVSSTPEESPESKNRKLQRELMAAAAEKRMMMMTKNLSAAKSEKSVTIAAAEKSVPVSKVEKDIVTRPVSQKSEAGSHVEGRKDLNLGEELSPVVANQLFSMVFGNGVSKDIIAQWTNQGIRFSPDPETCMGLVQHEGGPCGVLATIQAFVLKYLLFFPDQIGMHSPKMPQQNLGSRRLSQSDSITSGNFASLTEDGKARALVRSMVEILFLCGSKKRAVIATLSVLSQPTKEGSEYGQKDEIIAKTLEGLPVESAMDLQKVLRVNTYISEMDAFVSLQRMLPVFQSRMGAMLFLISALLSRGLESVQADRDDPSLPLVTAPFGHASQEIVNLLLCGQAVPNVFDGRMDLGGGMFLKGIPTSVDVGFLTLLESLNFCKVGRHLKCPKWPIWVVGSESHYTVLFALDTHVQDENELEERESQVRKAFDAQDQSGGGGFISVEGLHQVLRETSINLPTEKLDHLCSSGFIVWSEFWQLLLELDKSLGGLKDSSGLMGKKMFDLYHFNGIAKSVPNGSQAPGGEIPLQRPRLSKLRVSVPPRWTPEEFMADVAAPSRTVSEESTGKGTVVEVTPADPPQHAPLVDCIRTRWARAICNWVGDPPSIV
ncbi:ubiquitin carboxyl-terminal hydrolase MINDY-3-like [Macadamia integrifolia]|uniref:ubiquitin carboxyl-terminal hydrolase MINDY-3-like n=1 Tax=Macadamia integrifolia TaxID=60698 RepID=UPI001C4F2FF7|nr:ubiquitin carboxyl-terminal hydrolase MINDY-3-like [Macadamia integrifolia]